MPKLTWTAAVVAGLLLQAGCFNAEALIEARRLVAIRAQLMEVDLGNYRITLPQSSSLNETTEIRFHVFGKVANRDVKSVEEVLESEGPELRDKMIGVIRGLSPQQVEDPQLSALRQGIAAVINDSLEEEPVQSVGFYNFRYSQY